MVVITNNIQKDMKLTLTVLADRQAKRQLRYDCTIITYQSHQQFEFDQETK